MQKTVLEEIIKTEKEAEAIIQQAREKAGSIIAAADADYNNALLSAKEESRIKIQSSINSAQEKAESDFISAVKDAENENLAFFEKSSDRTDTIADLITDMLIKPEYERE